MNAQSTNVDSGDELGANPGQRTFTQIWQDGLWINNPGLVQLLGLCPLLAVSNTVINGLGLGLATLSVLVFSNLCVSLLRKLLRPEIRIIVYVSVIASLVTVVELLMRAFWHEIYLVLGLFIPLIVTNCMIVGRAEAFASRNSAGRSVVDALAVGLGFLLVLIALGAVRELLGHGTLLRDAHLLFGENARQWTLGFGDSYQGLVIALLPPGAFISLGFMVAAKNFVDRKLTH